jgi:hypothetical protein
LSNARSSSNACKTVTEEEGSLTKNEMDTWYGEGFQEFGCGLKINKVSANNNDNNIIDYR